MAPQGIKPTDGYKNFSLTRSVGLKTILEMRNEAQAAYMRMKDVPELMRHMIVDDEPAKIRRISHEDRKKMRSDLDIMELVIPSTDVTEEFSMYVVRPASPRDVIAVKLTDETIHKVIMYLRAAGIDDAEPSGTHDPMLGKGIYKRRHSSGTTYYITKDKKGKMRKCVDADSAARVQDRDDTDDEGPSASVVHVSQPDVSITHTASEPPARVITTSHPARQLALFTFFKRV
jgi:hypothetical protein